MLPTGTIMIRQKGAGVFGTVMVSVPSLAVLATNVLKVAPLSVEIMMFTVVVLIGAAVEPPKLQVMVWVEPTGHETLSTAGDVTANGPELAKVTVMSSRPV